MDTFLIDSYCIHVVIWHFYSTYHSLHCTTHTHKQNTHIHIRMHMHKQNTHTHAHTPGLMITFEKCCVLLLS